MSAGFGDVVAAQGRHRNGVEGLKPDLTGEGAEVGDDGVEHGLGPAHQVHLVHRQDDVANAQQADQIGVAAGLCQHPSTRVDQDDSGVGRRGAGDHVAGVLLVTRRIGDDELALFGREEAISDIDGDALLPLCGQTIDQQGEVDVSPLRAHAAAVRLQRRHLILEDHLGVVQQPSDQGGLAVVYAAAGDEAQQALVLVGVQIGVDVAGDQVGRFVRFLGHQK